MSDTYKIIHNTTEEKLASMTPQRAYGSSFEGSAVRVEIALIDYGALIESDVATSFMNVYGQLCAYGQTLDVKQNNPIGYYQAAMSKEVSSCKPGYLALSTPYENGASFRNDFSIEQIGLNNTPRYKPQSYNALLVDKNKKAPSLLADRQIVAWAGCRRGANNFNDVAPVHILLRQANYIVTKATLDIGQANGFPFLLGKEGDVEVSNNLRSRQGIYFSYAEVTEEPETLFNAMQLSALYYDNSKLATVIQAKEIKQELQATREACNWKLLHASKPGSVQPV